MKEKTRTNVLKFKREKKASQLKQTGRSCERSIVEDLIDRGQLERFYSLAAFHPFISQTRVLETIDKKRA